MGSVYIKSTTLDVSIRVDADGTFMLTIHKDSPLNTRYGKRMIHTQRLSISCSNTSISLLGDRLSQFMVGIITTILEKP